MQVKHNKYLHKGVNRSFCNGKQPFEPTGPHKTYCGFWVKCSWVMLMYFSYRFPAPAALCDERMYINGSQSKHITILTITWFRIIVLYHEKVNRKFIDILVFFKKHCTEISILKVYNVSVTILWRLKLTKNKKFLCGEICQNLRYYNREDPWTWYEPIGRTPPGTETVGFLSEHNRAGN